MSERGRGPSTGGPLEEPALRRRAGPGALGVTLDVWGTLLRLPKGDGERYAALREEAAALVLRDWIGSVGGDREREAARVARRVLREARLEEGRGISMPLDGQARRAGRLLGTRPRAREYEEAVGSVITRLPVEPVPGAPQAVRRLRGLGLRLGVVSNLTHESQETVRSLLRRFGMESAIDVWVTTDRERYCKPRPEPFQKCLRGLRVARSRAVHLGDTSFDVRGAIAADLRGVVLYDPPSRRRTPGERRALDRSLRHDERAVRVRRIADAPRAILCLLEEGPTDS